MTIYYSKSTSGFYDSDAYGTRELEVIDPAWVRPQISAADPDDPSRTILVDDSDAVPATLMVVNPDCKIPTDAVEIPAGQRELLLAAESRGERIQGDKNGLPLAVSPPAPTAQEIEAAKIAAAEAAVQKMLNDAAKAQRYDNILSAASYAALPADTPFQAEGAAFALWRAQCWAKCYEVLAAVTAGTRDEPTIEELLAEMPALVLP